MKTKKLVLGLILSLLSICAFSSGTIKGKIIDKQTGDPISFANIAVSQNDLVLTGNSSDYDGNFSINNVPLGIYDVIVSFVGYSECKIVGVAVADNKITYLNNIEIEPSAVILQECLIVEYKAPLISRDQACSASVVYKTSRNYGGQNDGTSVEHNTESYDFIPENNFKSSKRDPLSTFSIDVDRASYANIRRFINNSSMPNKDAVRIEELINYFDYDYPQPDNIEPFATHLEIGDCPWNSDNKLLMIGIQGEEVAVEDIPPCNLVFLIDVSGSMGYSNKLPLLKQSFKILISKLRPEDRVAIVVYAGAAGCVLPSTPGSEKETIIAALDKLESGGSTAGGAGIKLAYDIALEYFIEDGNNRVILATDGDFNVGASSDGEMERLIEKKRDLGVYLTVLGFGMGNYKDSKMEKLSNKGNGNYAYIDNIMESNKIFGQELWGTLYTIAKDVKIQVEFNPSIVKKYRLIGYENRMLNKEDFNDDKKDAGEIGSGHTVTAIYELVMNDGKKKSKNDNDIDPLNYQESKIIESKDIMTLKIRYKEPDKNKSKLITSKVTTEDIEKEEVSNNFMMAVAVAEFGMLLRDSDFKGESSYDHVLLWAKKSKGEDQFGYRNEFITLVQKVNLIANL